MPTTRVIDGFAISVEKNPVPQMPEEVFATIKTFGKQWTPHMFMVDWEAGKGWHDARIVPYQNLSIPPTAPCLHYGQEGFEGMKATRTRDGRIALFDPKANAERFMKTAKEVDMEPVPVDLFIAGLKALLLQERDYIPNDGNLYITTDRVGHEPILGAGRYEPLPLLHHRQPLPPILAPRRSTHLSNRSTLAQALGAPAAQGRGNYSRLTADKKWAREQFGCADDSAAGPGGKGEKGEKAYEGSYTIEKLREDLAKGVVKSVFSCGIPLVSAYRQSPSSTRVRMRIPMPEGNLPKKLFDYFNGLRDGTVEDTHGWMVFLD
ncbi:aminotransferase [Mycena olivaceomarginata]|nr:aminotransferase [Mycena olivaceomarginata]